MDEVHVGHERAMYQPVTSGVRVRNGIAVRVALCIVTAALSIALIVGVENLFVLRLLSTHQRFDTDFSARYLAHQIEELGSGAGHVVFLGDSVLWGYYLGADDTAIAALRRAGCSCDNFAFKAGGPPNYYVLARLLLRSHVRPGVVVVEVNQMLFNQADPWFKSLHPAVAELGGSLITPADRRLLKPYSVAPTSEIMRYLDKYVLAYSMRSDIRDLANTNAKADIPHVNADDLMGTYDLDPLTNQNVGVHFLDETVKALTGAGIPVIAIMTPTNHTLMHEYIDVPEYDANVEYIADMLKRDGARIIGLDRAFAAGEFVDNDHLNQKGQAHLSAILTREIGIR